jgi:DNA-binding NtrC family response regulator
MNKRVLVVDPDVVDRYIAKKILSEDYDVITLSSAKEAMAFARSNTFEVAIIHHKLVNHFDGITLLGQLRNVNKTFLPIATTAIRDNHNELLLKTYGFKEVAEKPLTSERLRQVLCGNEGRAAGIIY